MGFIRGMLLVFVSIIFLLSVLSSGILYTISSSLSYNQIQGQAFAAAEPLIGQLNLSQYINSNIYFIKSYCNANPEFVLSSSGYTFHFPCSDVNDTSLMINDTIKNFIHDIYYQSYNCNYWDCFSKYNSPLFLISEKSQNYWQGLFYYALGIAVLSAAILFFLFKKKYDLFFMAGIVIIFSSLFVLGIEKIISIFSGQIFSSVAMLFFSQSHFVFIRMLIGGIILIVAGLVVELFRAGFKIYDMFSRIGQEEKAPEKAKTQVQSGQNKNKKPQQKKK